MDKNILKLKDMYSQKSKHSNYQVLSRKLSTILGNDVIDVKSRYENERLEYIKKNIDIKEKRILDIGGNSGFFTYEMIDSRAKSVHYYEGNKIHSEFVKLASKVLNIEEKIKVTNDYFDFDKFIDNKYDVVLLLNVLHHVGDDYGEMKLSKKKAKETIIKQLNSIAKISDLVVFQLGFNWKGNRDLGLFKNGTKRELIDFITEGTREYFEICKIGIAQSSTGKIQYSDLDEKNIERDDSVGEFLNRPIFIMKSIS